MKPHGIWVSYGDWWSEPDEDGKFYLRDEVDEEMTKLRTENERLHKLFDDAGQGEYNVLALVEHWQGEAIRAQAENDRLRKVPEQLISMVEARAEWAQGIAQRNPSSPWQEVRQEVADELEVMAENLRAFMAARDESDAAL